jgi:hypothetical protein
MRRMILAAAAGGLAVVAAISLTAYFYERPTIVRVAVARDSDDHHLLMAYAQVFAREREPVRLRVVPVDSVTASGAALDARQVDLAVVRTDIGMPRDGQTAVILRRSAAILVAPGGSAIARINDLGGRPIGVLVPRRGAGANVRVLDMILARYDVEGGGTRKIPLTLADLPAALADRRIEALFAVGPTTSGALASAIDMVAASGSGPPAFIPIAEAKAIAQRIPAFEPLEVPRGAFGGAIPRPAKDIQTLAVSTRLVARTDLADPVVGDITRVIFAQRPTVAANQPLANLMEAPATDKDQALPVHTGAAAFLDGDEQTFLDKYSDYIYIGAMVLSVLASAAAALASRLTSMNHVRIDEMLEKLFGILALARQAQSEEALGALEREADDVLVEAHRIGLLKTFEAHQLGALSLALNQVRFAIRDRRRQCAGEARAPAAQPIRIVSGGGG